MKFRVPLPPFERSKRTIFLVLLGVALEYVDPLPFFKSAGGWILYMLLVMEIAKQFIVFRLEYSSEAIARAEAMRQSWDTKRDRFSEQARYRIRRALFAMAGLWVYGQVISLFTDRCEGGFQCALLSVQLFTESIPTILQVMVGVAFGIFQLVLMMFAITKVGGPKLVMPGTIDVTFNDIYGQDRARDKVKEVVEMLDNDDKIVAAGGHMEKGILLTGPPGTGKTMLAKAAANYSSKPLILVPPGGFAAMFMGVNFLKVYQLGRQIRRISKRYGGVIIFLDEVDALGNRGGEIDASLEPWFLPNEPGCLSTHTSYPVVVTGGGGMNMGTLEAFLAMMDGMDEPRGFVNRLLALAGFKPLPPPKVRPFYLGATNRPSVVDPALKRSGRFGEEVRVDFPKLDGRIKTYEGYLAKVQNDVILEQIEALAKVHYRGTGAEMEDVVNKALLQDFRHGGDGFVTAELLEEAMIIKRFGESDGTFEDPASVRSTAIHEMGHALVMYATSRQWNDIWFTSIEQRGRAGGMVVPAPYNDDWHQHHDEMIADVASSLGSRVAELKNGGQMSNGHGGDGPAATMKAEKMVAYGHTFEILELEPEGDAPDEAEYRVRGQIGFTDQREAEEFHRLREEVLIEAYLLASKIIDKHNDALLAGAELLVEKGTVMGRELVEIFEAYDVE